MKANEILTDKNGREMRTGDIVKIEGAYFKNDNGYYYIERCPGDPSWSGLNYSLHKIGKRGKISEAKYSIAFWPLWACTNDHFKNAAAEKHNAENATIEIISGIDNAEVVKHFRKEAENNREAGIEYGRRWGADSETALKYADIANFFEEVAARISAKEDPADLIQAPELVASVVYDFGASDEEPEPAAEPEQMTLDIFVTITEPVEPPKPGHYTTPEEMRAAFIADGWTDPVFEKITEDGKTLFRMAVSGDIYDDRGRIYRYNIPVLEKPKTIPAPVFVPEAPETPEALEVEEIPAEDIKAPETTPDAPTTAYYDVNESTAERAWYAVHMSDYKKDSATNEYRASVDAAAQIAAEQKNRVSPYYHDKIDYLLDKYSKKLAAWYNDYNRNEASCPSWFISGPANYPVRKHERKMNRERTLWEEYDSIKGIIDKIKSIGTGPIDLSDPHAREMLEERLKDLQHDLDRSKELNAYWRKHKTFVGFPDLSPEKAEQMTADFLENIERCPWITKPAPDYELTSLRDRIKRTQERLAELDKREAAIEAGEDDSEKFNGGEIVRNIELDRLQIIFDDKPDEEMREKLKSNGFRWSPKNSAWQRQLTPNAERALKYLKLN